MSDFVAQIVLGIIQGVAEWLPISSSGHLAAASILLNFSGNIGYDVFLHLGSLLIIIFYFRRDIIKLVQALGRPDDKESRLWLIYITASTLVTVGVVYLAKDYVSIVRFDSQLLAGAFLLTSAVVGFSVIRSRSRPLTIWPALIIGLAQGIAVIPGLSRSGVTIGLALLLGLKKNIAFRFSFMMAIPVITAASIYSLPSLEWRPIYLVGFSTVLIIGYFTLAFLEKVIYKDWFHFFAIYTIVLSMILFYA
jgi:undecaprenyl-diphosphatase